MSSPEVKRPYIRCSSDIHSSGHAKPPLFHSITCIDLLTLPPCPTTFFLTLHRWSYYSLQFSQLCRPAPLSAAEFYTEIASPRTFKLAHSCCCEEMAVSGISRSFPKLRSDGSSENNNKQSSQLEKDFMVDLRWWFAGNCLLCCLSDRVSSTVSSSSDPGHILNRTTILFWDFKDYWHVAREG